MDIEKKKSEDRLSEIEVHRQFFYLSIKRLIDLIVSFIGVILLLPFFAIISLIIKFDDPSGPILFKQERVGMNERSFQMYKFRSMHSGAENKIDELLQFNEVEGAMFKMKNDPRITKFGKFIRKFSIDELPQLFNVIKGEMSLVGPRPPLLRELKEYSYYDKQRLKVKPGITGLWQVSGRSSLSFSQMVALDLKYIKEQSIIKDIKILLLTVVVIFKSNNEAY